jgi:crossover junction endodeoxyribonuclease RuvC
VLVVGVDPGTINMGVGAVLSDDDLLTLAYSEVLSPPKSAPLSDRLGWLHERMSRALEDIRPSVVAIEQPFVARNVKAALAVGQAQAVAMIAAARLGIPVAGYSPSEVKKAVTDYGGSSKEQVQQMVSVLLGMDEILEPPDRADALAVAICHINRSRALEIAEL